MIQILFCDDHPLDMFEIAVCTKPSKQEWNKAHIYLLNDRYSCIETAHLRSPPGQARAVPKYNKESSLRMATWESRTESCDTCILVSQLYMNTSDPSYITIHKHTSNILLTPGNRLLD